MANFFLASLPLLVPNVRYYPASYVYSIIKGAAWQCKYVDFNQLIFELTPAELKKDWKNHAFNRMMEIVNDDEKFEEQFQFADQFMREKLSQEFNKVNYDLIGVSLYNSCRRFSSMFLRTLRELDIQAPVIFGGPDCFPAWHNINYLTEHKYTPDIVFSGEGEIAFPEFLKEYERTRDIKTRIGGFAYKDDSGNVVNNPLGAPPKLEELKIIADYGAYTDPAIYPNQTINTFTSRGCVIKCKFCTEWLITAPYRRRNQNVVVEELINTRKYLPDSHNLWLLDSNLNLSERHVVNFSKTLLKANMDIQWRSMASFRAQMSDDALSLMKRSGCVELMLGLESASQPVLDYMNKRFDINLAVDTLAKYQKHGIKIRMPIMNGFPGEFTNDFLTTSAFILTYGSNDALSFSYSNKCMVFEKAELDQHPEDFYIDISSRTKSPDAFQLLDGLNTSPVRTIRMLLNMFCIGTSVKRRGNYNFDEFKTLKTLNFNNLSVAMELAQIIYQLGRLTNSSQEALFLLNREDVQTEDKNIVAVNAGRVSFLQNAIPGLCLKNWLIYEKNSDELKESTMHFIQQKYRLLADSLELTENLDFKDFRNRLFQIDDYKLERGDISELHLAKVHSTLGDGGGFLIINGYTANFDKKIMVSKVLIKTKDNIIELHCGAHSPEGAKTYLFPGSEYSGFWGKVKKSYLDNNKLEIMVVYNDQTVKVYELDVAF